MRDVLADFPEMVVADIAVIVDWRRSRRQLSDLVARLRPEYRETATDVEARPIEGLSAGPVAASDIECGQLSFREVVW
ncbi:hypothetical protein [Sinomonas soli]